MSVTMLRRKFVRGLTAFAPNQTDKDFTCDFDVADPNTGLEQA